MVMGDDGMPDSVFSINYLKTRDAEMEPFCRDALNYLKKHRLIYENYRDLSTANCLVRDKIKSDREGILPSSSDESTEESERYYLEEEEEEPLRNVSYVIKDTWEGEYCEDDWKPSIVHSDKRQLLHQKYKKLKPGKFTHKMMIWLKTQMMIGNKKAAAKQESLKQTARKAKQQYETDKALATEDPETYLTGIQERVFKTLNKGVYVDPTPEQMMTPQEHHEGIRAILNKLMNWGHGSSDDESDSIARQEVWNDVNEVFDEDAERRKIDEKCDEGVSKFIEYHSLKSRVGCIYNKIPESCHYNEEEDVFVRPSISSDTVLHRISTLCTNLTTDPCLKETIMKKPKTKGEQKTKLVKEVRKEPHRSTDALVLLKESKEVKASSKGHRGATLTSIKTMLTTRSNSETQINISNKGRYIQSRKFKMAGAHKVDPCKDPTTRHIKGMLHKVLADPGVPQHNKNDLIKQYNC